MSSRATSSSDDVVKYATSGGIATITLNRPERLNTLRTDMGLALDNALRRANRDDAVKVIVLEGAGDSFCAGFDFSNGLEHAGLYREDGYDPGMDVFLTTSSHSSGIVRFMELWRSLKPTIAKVHGWCVGGGS